MTTKPTGVEHPHTEHLHGAHLETYRAIFRHPAPHNLRWHDVHAMLKSLAVVTEEPNGNSKVVRNGKTLTLRPHAHKDVNTSEELTLLKHFLRDTDTQPTSATERAVASAHAGHPGPDMLVVIDHRHARIFRSETPHALPLTIANPDPTGEHRHLRSVTNEDNGQRLAESKGYYTAVIDALKDANRILIFGSATGESSAMVRLQHELQTHHKPLATRVLSTHTVDDSHLTNDELIKQARELFAAPAQSSPA